MLLLNAVRAGLTLFALLIVHAFQVAYQLSGLALILVLVLALFAVFFIGDLIDASLIARFNKDEPEKIDSIT